MDQKGAVMYPDMMRGSWMNRSMGRMNPQGKQFGGQPTEGMYKTPWMRPDGVDNEYPRTRGYPRVPGFPWQTRALATPMSRERMQDVGGIGQMSPLRASFQNLQSEGWGTGGGLNLDALLALFASMMGQGQ